ncbi:hypothetical protein [Qipengyuania sediminis]|uniref:hypothetical protein n=1 Tax=Qipengyuania sediminis TaxID=1532023 RepID=UPI001059F2AB|nr:hypothetical protein [Qipengyuania sediminis]
MKFRKVTLAAAAAAAATAPLAGQAIAAERTSAPVAGENQLGEGPIGILIILAVLAVAIGVVAGDDEPNSP